MSSWPASETELAPPIIAYLEHLHWDIYQEVQPKHCATIADIVAVQNKVVWVIELKRTFSLDVIHQARQWRRLAHYTSIVVPHVPKRTDGRIMGEQILKDWGIGIMEVRPPSFSMDQVERVERKHPPALHRSAMASQIRDSLSPEHKTFAAAGTASSSRWTPFRRTCQDVLNVVTEQPGILLKDLVEQIKHHYTNDQSARGALAEWIRKGVVPGVRLEEREKRLHVFLS